MQNEIDKSLILRSSDVRSIVHHYGVDKVMDDTIDRLTTAIKTFNQDQTVIPVRAGFCYEQPTAGLIEWMPLMNTGDKVMIKTVGYHPANPVNHALPTILSSIAAYDTNSGHLLGMVDGVLLTALRTGAASAVASQYLAHPDSKILGLIGCGAQSITQLHALSRIFSLTKVLIYDISESAMDSFAKRASVTGLDVSIIPTNIPTVVGESDILVTATTKQAGSGPLFDDLDTKSLLHVNAVGSDFPGKVELPVSLLEQSFVCADFPEQAVLEGECQQLPKSAIGPGWVEVIQNHRDYHHIKSERTVFDSTGWPLEDLVIMELFLEYARKLGLGEEIAIELLSDDAKNPYDFMRKLDPTRIVK